MAGLAIMAAGGFDWSSGLISAAAVTGLVIAVIAVASVFRDSKDR